MPKVSNMRNDKWPDVFLWFNLGFCALVSQVVFQRECINTFAGNELSIGLVLFVWLLFGGIGSVTMGKAASRLSPAGRSRLRLWLLTGLGLLFPCTLIAIRPVQIRNALKRLWSQTSQVELFSPAVMDSSTGIFRGEESST